MTEVSSFPIGLWISDMRVQLVVEFHTFAFHLKLVVDLDQVEQPK